MWWSSHNVYKCQVTMWYSKTNITLYVNHSSIGKQIKKQNTQTTKLIQLKEEIYIFPVLVGDFNIPLRNWETENQHVFYSHFGMWYVLSWHKIEVRMNATLATWEIYVCIIKCVCKCLYLDRKIKKIKEARER